MPFTPDTTLEPPKKSGFVPDSELATKPTPERRRALDIMGGDSKLDRDRALLRSDAGRAELASRNERDNAGLLADILMEGGGAAVGQLAGAHPALSVPTMGLSIPAGGALAGMAGNYAAQKRRIAAGEQQGFRVGELLGTGLLSAVPGGPEITGGRALMREAGKQALAGGAAKVIETGIDEGRLPTGTETVLSTAVPAVGGALAQKLGTRGADPLNPTKRATLDAGTAAGLVVTPSSVMDLGVNRRLESIAGKAGVGQAASIRNQEVTTRLAKEALGIPVETDITQAVLRDIRRDASGPYGEIEAMATRAQADLADVRARTRGMTEHETEALRSIPGNAERIRALSVQAGADIEALREARDVAKKNYLHYQKTGTPSALDTAEAAQTSATMLEDRIEAAAREFGTPDLVERLRTARQRIAQTYDVENALNLGDSQVSARLLARALDKGRPLSGNLETVARFAEAFPSVMRDGAGIPTPGVSKVEAGTAALLGALGIGATHSPIGAAMGALPLISGPVRGTLLSRPYQALATARPFEAMPNAATGTRLLSQAAGQQLSEKTGDAAGSAPVAQSKTETAKEPDLASLSAPDRAQAIDRQLRALKPADQLKFWKKITSGENPIVDQAVRDELLKLDIKPPSELQPAPAAEAQKDSPKKTSQFIEGKIYRDPESGIRMRFRNGQFENA